MKRATSVIIHAERVGQNSVDTISLVRADRYKRRFAFTTDHGHTVLLDLPEPTYLAHGDALVLDDGTLVEVRAAAEPLLEIRAPDQAGLARIAWHIGNRHSPAEITEHAIYIQSDHVLESMVTGLGAHVRHVMRAFEPEGGAYGGKGALHRGHHHGTNNHEAHDHLHQINHDHEHGAAQRPPIWRPD